MTRYIHAPTPNVHEITLCGWAADAPETEPDCPYLGPGLIISNGAQRVTCPECKATIVEIRDYIMGRSPADER